MEGRLGKTSLAIQFFYFFINLNFLIMKKMYFLTLAFGLIFFGLNNANAQDFPWPDLGEAKIIEPGAPGVINETIHADTSATGERLHNHYILRRGQTYLYTARIQNTGYPLM